MNKLAWLFGGSTLLLGASCLYLLIEPRADSAATQSDGELQRELTQLRADRDRLETDVRSMRAAQVVPTLAPQPTAAVVPPSAAPAPVVPSLRPDLSPKSRRTMVRMRNGKMLKQLGLSAAEEESLLDVLVAQEERMNATKPTSTPEELRAKNRAEVAGVIGDESAERLDAWQQAQSARMEMRRVRDQLEDVPRSADGGPRCAADALITNASCDPLRARRAPGSCGRSPAR